MKLGGLLPRCTAPFKEFGVTGGLLYVVDRLASRVSPRLRLFAYELMVQPVKSEPILVPERTKNLTFKELCRGDPDIDLIPARENVKATRFEQGARCLGVYRGHSLIGYIWLCLGKYAEDEVRCTYHMTPAECSAFDFDLYVMPDHRLGIAFAAIWHGANEFLRARKVKQTFSRVSRFNVASRRAHARLGSHSVGQALFFKAYQLELLIANLPPYVAFTWAPAQRANLRLSCDT